MAEDADQRTEEPTPRKRQKLQEEGQIPKSQDVGAAVVVAAASAAVSMYFDSIASALVAFARRMFQLEDVHEPFHAFQAQLEVLKPAMIPLFVASGAAVIAGAAQSRTFSLSLLAPKPERFNPIPALMQMLPNKQSLMEISKQVLKLLAIGYIAYAVVRDATPMFSTLSFAPALSSAKAVGGVVVKLVTRVSMAFLTLAVLDYWLAYRKFINDAKMSKQEVRDEHKQEEGRPEVKMRMRQRMREMSKRRKTADISKATVLVTNPTHYAVALRYDPEKDVAPLIIAKGLDELALAMRAKARKHGVPIVEQRPLARALYAAKVGRPIPIELYRGVAEVIAYVMQIRAREAGVVLTAPEPALAEETES